MKEKWKETFTFPTRILSQKQKYMFIQIKI